MDIFERLNKTFAVWYENLFGDAASDLRPKDVLRRIVGAMEDNRKEGLDNRVYVPNKYVLEIAFDSDEEREYLLAFLEKEELEAALRKYLAQNKYCLRGQLDFTVEEVAREEGADKLRVKCRWDTSRPAVEAEPVPIQWEEQPRDAVPLAAVEDLTVAATDMYEAGTVAPPVLEINHVDGSSEQVALAMPSFTIGRSKHAGNDLVIEKDGMVSKRHARIELSAEGFAIEDTDSTNGVWVNGEQVASRLLRDGDLIRLGATELVFRESARCAIDSRVSAGASNTRPRLVASSGEEYLLASEMVIGGGLTSDVRLSDPSVSVAHAKVFSSDGTEYYVEDLGTRAGTFVNDVEVITGSAVRLNPGDQVKLGEVVLRFECD